MSLYLKFLSPGGLSYKGKWTKGRWRSVSGELVPCHRGLHVCRQRDAIYWLNSELWLAEIDGEHVTHNVGGEASKVVARKARIVARVESWDETTARLFAADCAERVLPLFERQRPNDDRPRRAIEAARAYTRGEIGRDELGAARAAAWVAGDAAARVAGGAAAWVAGDAAARVAGGAAWAAARGAARDARDARDAAGDAGDAGDAERQWQTARLAELLDLDALGVVP